MNIYIIAVGRMKKSAEYDLLKTYLKRCPWDIRIIEVEEKRPLKAGPRMKREGELLLKAIPQSAIIIALDERGEKLRSTNFANKVSAWQDQGVVNLVFLIGGADGYDEKIKSQ